jgi:hypothetical protein
VPADAVVPEGITLRCVAGDDPLMREVADLCYETLHRPFDVTMTGATRTRTRATSSHSATVW